jgi:hypothetical protein
MFRCNARIAPDGQSVHDTSMSEDEIGEIKDELRDPNRLIAHP